MMRKSASSYISIKLCGLQVHGNEKLIFAQRTSTVIAKYQWHIYGHAAQQALYCRKGNK